MMKERQGFTLVEVLLVVAISAVLLSGAVLSIHQILTGTTRNENRVVTLTDISQATLAIKNDLLMAQTTDLSSIPKSSANLTWMDYTTSFGNGSYAPNSSQYTLQGKELHRIYTVTSNSTTTTTETIVGRNITSLSFTQSDKLVTVVISTSNTTNPTGTETLSFNVHLRSQDIIQ